MFENLNPFCWLSQVMTTNHPEHLDPALIRPGRINKQLLLGHLQAQQAAEMVDYYFHACGAGAAVGGSPLTPDQRARLDAIVEGGPRLTPAALESMCVEFDDVDGLLDKLEELQQEVARAAALEEEKREEKRVRTVGEGAIGDRRHPRMRFRLTAMDTAQSCPELVFDLGAVSEHPDDDAGAREQMQSSSGGCQILHLGVFPSWAIWSGKGALNKKGLKKRG